MHYELIKALRPFADALDEWGDEEATLDRRNLWEHPAALNITIGDLRTAAHVISQFEETP